MQRPALRFAITGVALVVLALPFGSMVARYGLELQAAALVLSPDRVFFVMAAFSGMFAAAYAAFPMNRRAAAWHFWVTISGIVGFSFSFCLWAYLVNRRVASLPDAPRLETATDLAFMLSFLLLLFSPAIFCVNFTFAMGKMRTARKPR